MNKQFYDPIKRVMDIAIALPAFILSAPLQLVIGALVRKWLGPPVLFRQLRPGKGERIFEMVKFRTMLEPDPQSGRVSDVDRITPFGTWLRSTSLDELPTLWNVVKGDMSLVGPRPLLVDYLDRYSPEQRRRHAVRPGLTGLAQVSGRNKLSWPEKFELDLRYVEERCLATDAKIMGRTLLTVLARQDIASHGNVTMPEFRGETW